MPYTSHKTTVILWTLITAFSFTGCLSDTDPNADPVFYDQIGGPPRSTVV